MDAETEEMPVVKATRFGSAQIKIECPYCHGTHIHGAAGVPGVRVSHCSKPHVGGNYRVEMEG